MLGDEDDELHQPATNPYVKSWSTDPTNTYRVFTIELNWPDDQKGMG